MAEGLKSALTALYESFEKGVDATNAALYTYILIILLVLAGQISSDDDRRIQLKAERNLCFYLFINNSFIFHNYGV